MIDQGILRAAIYNHTPRQVHLDIQMFADPAANDELDIIGYGRTRTRKIMASANASGARRPYVLGKRVGSDVMQDDVAQKKLKVDDKRAMNRARALATVGKKLEISAAQKRWLYCHRNLFQPLLSSTSVFDNLEKTVSKDGSKINFVPYHSLDAQPLLVEGGSMKDYQLQGLSFLVYMYNNGMNCLLGDEMGLGKTLQTLSLFAYIKENAKGVQDPYLVICPLSVLSSWLSETNRWLPTFRALRFHGSQSERNRLRNQIKSGEIKFDLCIATYESFVAEENWFKTRRWFYCVLDEGHRIKNSETAIYSKLQGIGSTFRLILTGTPVQNNLLELWSLLHWLYPFIFTAASERMFKEAFNLTKGLYSLPFLTAAQNLLAAIMLRRTKSVVEMTVPPCEEFTIFVPMTEAQRFWTYRLLTRMDTLNLEQIFTTKVEDSPDQEGRREVLSHITSQLNGSQAGEASRNRWRQLMNLVMQLREICDHPYMLEDASPNPYSIGEHIVASSSKLITIDKILAYALPKGERIIIFSQWTSMLDLLEDFMHLRSIPFARLDGNTPRARRTLDIKLFQQENSPYKVFLISTKAGGLGINLNKATTVIMCDCDWNPQNDLQAIARAHRIGQTKIVKVYRLICRGSVEDQMLDRIRRKLFLSLKVVTSDSSSDQNSRLKTGELLDILRKGSSALAHSEDSLHLTQFLQASFEEILEISRSLGDARNAKVKRELELQDDKQLLKAEEALVVSAEEEERLLLQGVAQVESRLFEGKLVHKPQNNRQIANEWQELQKRARVDRTVMVNGIPVIAEHMGPAASMLQSKSQAIAKRQRQKFEWEDWCIYCRDGGELAVCDTCPRVFHPTCHGLTDRDVARAPKLTCSQHSCATCSRDTAQAGGMLFRCRTCPQAFCEDCLPEGDIDAVGPELPEFVVLGYGEKPNAYYIRCHDCQEYFAENPTAWKDWQGEMEETEAKYAHWKADQNNE